MAEAASEQESKRRLEAFNSTKTPAHPTGSMTLAAKKLGYIGPNALSKWLRDRSIKTDRKPLKTIQQCIDGLRLYIRLHKRIPSRDEFTANSAIGVKWKTHWNTWQEFLTKAGVINDPAKILVLDIETAPNRAYFWGPVYKQNINPDWIDANGYVLCWTAKWLGSEEVFFQRLFNRSHKTLLMGMHKLLDEAHAVIHYNGKKFDIPTLNKEFLTHGINPPSPFKHIDLLKTMWDVFLFPSNKLGYIARTLSLGEKVKHEGGPELWLQCMDGNEEAWKKMEEYNRRDVELTEKLYIKLRPWIRSHPNVSSGSPTCPTCGSFNFNQDKEHMAQVLKYARYKCADCGSWFRSNKSVTPRGERHVAAV